MKRNKINSFKKDQKGITLMTLVITIVVLVILASVAAYTGVETIDSSRLTRFSAEVQVMQTEVGKLYDKWKAGDESILSYGESIVSGQGRPEVVKQADFVFDAALKNSGITFSTTAEREEYRYYTSSFIKQELGIDGIEQDYFVNVKERRVVSYKGLKYRGNYYFIVEQLPGASSSYNVEFTKENEGIQENQSILRFSIRYQQETSERWKIEVYNIRYMRWIYK